MSWQSSRQLCSSVNTTAWNRVRDEGSVAMDQPSFAELVSRARGGKPDAVRRLEQYPLLLTPQIGRDPLAGIQRHTRV
jgi:hypothetical protein